MDTRFEWDAKKAVSNMKKHGVSFEIALRVFADPLAWSEQDRTEDGEKRWKTIGMVEGWLLLVVAHTFREEVEEGATVEVIRLISARRADRRERSSYEEVSQA